MILYLLDIKICLSITQESLYSKLLGILPYAVNALFLTRGLIYEKEYFG